MYHIPNPYPLFFVLRCKINFFKNIFRSHILALTSVIIFNVCPLKVSGKIGPLFPELCELQSGDV